MGPRFVIVDGAAAGQVFGLEGGRKTVGRGPGNDIDIVDMQISKRHCLVKSEGEEFSIVDLGSRNGIFVNDTRISEVAVLKDGDEVRLGGTRLMFCTEDSAPQVPSESRTILQNVELVPSESAYLKTTLSPEAANKPRVARDLNVLLRLSEEINAIRRSDVLQEKLLERIFDIVPAEQGTIRLSDEKQHSFVSTVSRQRDSGVVRTTSETITRRVLDRGVAVLANDVLSEGDPSESLIVNRIHSVLCVPLILFQKKIGVIYLDTRDPSTPFDARHLELLTAIASIAAMALEHVRYVEWLENENTRLDLQITTHYSLIGDGAKMREVKRMISRAARAGSTVLITGESGTGKEMVAWAIHRHSHRADHRFIAVNCGAIPRDLVESELFGHKKGSFSGADKDRKGHFEEANGGTIFLDEVAELPLETQVKLLRVLSTHQVVPVGTSQPLDIDLQVVAATNRDLEKLVAQREFREDLFYRLNVLRVNTPTLRERTEDLPALVNHFFQKYKHKAGRELVGTHPDFMKVLAEHNWPGNIRELENAIEFAIVVAEGDRLRVEDLPQTLSGVSSSGHARKFYAVLEDASRQAILQAFRMSEAATFSEVGQALGLHENLLHRKVTELGIRAEVDSIRQSKHVPRKPLRTSH
jgi:transcriptional regulator with GAF, ATPase, and Fis domain